MRVDRRKTLFTVLEETNARLKADEDGGATVWPSGFVTLDEALTAWFRSGELALLGSRPGLGKTTFALQMSRNLIGSERSVVYFSFEHDNHFLLARLIVTEARPDRRDHGGSAVRGPCGVQAGTGLRPDDAGTSLRH